METIAVNRSLQHAAHTGLSPACIVEVEDDRVLLSFPDREIWALMALAFPYQPVPGDLVLAIGQEDAWYVIGVLKGRGQSVFKALADLKLFAPNGKIELIAGEEVNIRSGTLLLAANRIEFLADTIHERFRNAYRWVQGIFHLRSRHAYTQVQETYRVKAGRIVQRADGDVHVDGRKIHLG